MSHTILLAITVGDKYSANDVRQEIIHFLPYLDSELFNTLTAIYTARIKEPVQTFTVWTSNKADGCTTYEELMAYEKSTGYGYSSQVTTDNIEGIVDAVNNELDGELLYHLEDAS